jgi:Tfp pilus assembly protein PilX
MNLPIENRGAALITVVILIIVLTILSTVILSILSNQTRYIEHNIARTKSKYATEAAMVRALDSLRRLNTTDTSHNVSGRYDDFNQVWSVNITRGAITSGSFANTDQLNLSLNYSTGF